MKGHSPAESHHFIEGCHGRWQSASRLPCLGSPVVIHPHPNTACLGMGVGKVEHLFDRVFRHDGVGIKQQYILCLGLTYGDIVGFGESEIMSALNQPYTLQTGQIFHRTVARVIIHDNNLRVNALQCSTHTVDTLPDVIFHVVIDDYYR